MSQTIALVLFDDFQQLDAAGPAAVFEVANAMRRSDAYRLRVLSVNGGAVRASSGIVWQTEPAAACKRIDTLLVAGGNGARSRHCDPALIALIERRAAKCRRVASVCTGAFLLARAGVLDGRAATTHWRHSSQLRRQFPGITVSADQIWLRDGRVWTSGGVTAGIDLALALVADDFGNDLAKAIARELLVYFRRPAGQSQFSALEELNSDNNRLAPVLAWARQNIHRPLKVDDLAVRAAMSPRNFSRLFRQSVGKTPAKALELLRLEVAVRLLEDSESGIERIAQRSGFGNAERMRRAFIRTFGQAPRRRRGAQAAWSRSSGTP